MWKRHPKWWTPEILLGMQKKKEKKKKQEKFVCLAVLHLFLNVCLLLWGHFPVEGIFRLELTWVQTPFPQKLFRMRV